MDMVISNHSPFVKVWFIIQLIAKHFNWWMWIGYQPKFNMLHLKISPWILGDSLWFSNKIRSFSCSFVVFETFWEQKSACILTWQVQRTESCLIISAVCKVFECANTTGRWDKHVNRKCKACGMCMSQWVFDLWINHYLYRIIGFHMPIDSLRSHICIRIQSNHFFFIQTRYQQSWLFFSTNVFLHPCRMVFWARKTRVFWLSKSTCPKEKCVWANWVYNW